MKTCVVNTPEGQCERPHYARGWCFSHYQRWRLNGDVNEAKPLKAAPRSGSITPQGYVQLHVDGEKFYQHRRMMEEMLGRKLYPGENVHHKNGCRDDNRPENLELWVENQPTGQRVEDLLDWAWQIIERYG